MKEAVAAHRRRLPLRQPELGHRRRSGALRLDAVHARAAARGDGGAVEGAARRRQRRVGRRHGSRSTSRTRTIRRRASSRRRTTIRSASPTTAIRSSTSRWSTASPLYLGADYDPGTRVGRITKRIKAIADGGGKLTLDDMQSIQADAVSEWSQALAPTFIDGGAGAAGGDRDAGDARRAVAARGAGEPDLEAAAAAGAGAGAGLDELLDRVGRRRGYADGAADRRLAGGGDHAGVDPPLRRSRVRGRVLAARRDAELVRAAQAAGAHGATRRRRRRALNPRRASRSCSTPGTRPSRRPKRQHGGARASSTRSTISSARSAPTSTSGAGATCTR